MKPYFTRGNITLYHGDYREVIPSLPKAALVLADPPYGLGKKLNGGSWGNISEWDYAIDPQVVISMDSEIIMWGGNFYPLPPCRGWLAWFKPDAPPSMGHFELAWRSIDTNTRAIKCSIAETNAERVGHPTQKPLRVMQWSIEQAKVQTGLILDPFAGSGTTLVAARSMMRPAIGIEIEERYCEIAAVRLSTTSLFDELLDKPIDVDSAMEQTTLFSEAAQ
jgi:DNA modification methylase